ncbi:MAG: ABC transporter ATP-binding protein [Candidatus Hydrogenedentes bacterium]|nr:ABC transporter ATP-binding protein [Candidatus Hydrogenedentota bacterium]
MDTIIEISQLDRRYGSLAALDDVSLTVPRAGVFGLVGENGAGKTTLIHHILGLLRAQRGAVRVFGLDPVAEPARVLGRVGVVTEDRDLPAWMRVEELMRFTRTFYPSWDDAYAEELLKTFGLDASARIGTLSQGQLAKASLLVALAHRPDLLVLDEPSSGLDPVVRRDILEAIVLTVADSGRTVFFSSHLLDEVERVSDRVAMMKSGRLVLNAPTDALKNAHHRLIVRARTKREAPPNSPGTISCRGQGPEWTLLCVGELDRLAHTAQGCGLDIVLSETPSLNEIFVARCALPAVAQERFNMSVSQEA